MRFLADECVSRVTIELLRRWGHEVETAQEARLTGQEDAVVVAYAVRGRQVLITSDMHFSNILIFPPSEHLGIIVLKIRPRTQRRVHAVVSRYLTGTSQDAMRNTLVIVDGNKYRVRRG